MSADKHNQSNNASETDVSAPIQSSDDISENKAGSALNGFFWFIAIISFIAATLVNQYLPAYWQPASSIWVRIGIILGLVICGLLSLFMTQQGKGFFGLLSDSQVELRRVTWPNREETFEYTWKTLLVMVLTGILIWFLDGIFNVLVGAIIGH